MRICKGCGMVLGRDCFNEPECMWIAQQEEATRARQFTQEASVLQDRIATLEAQLEAAQKQAAQMRATLVQLAAIAKPFSPLSRHVNAALSIDAGKGYVSIEQLKPLVTKWNGLADDHAISGAESEARAQCAEDLREVLEGAK